MSPCRPRSAVSATPWLIAFSFLIGLAVETVGYSQDTAGSVVGEYQANDSLNAHPEKATKTASESLDRILWEPASFPVTVESVKGTSNSPDCLIRFPSPKPTGDAEVDEVCCEWYRCQNAGTSDLPAVLVLHESGSGMTVGRVFAQEIRRRGVHAFLMHMPGYGERKSSKPPADDLISVFVQGVADARRAKDAIAVLPGIADERIGLQGTSLGGFVASLVGGLDGDFRCVFLCLSGGDLHGILTSGEREARKAMEKLLATGIKPEELQAMLSPIEPLSLASRLNPEKTWLYRADFDQVVPPRHSDLLAEAIGLSEEHYVKLLATHYSGIVYLPGICDKLVQVVRE
jgi:dienelactone hydrolase